MPPPTLWSGNPEQEMTINDGNLAYDDPNTTYDQAVYYDGVPEQNLTPQYVPQPQLWAGTDN